MWNNLPRHDWEQAVLGEGGPLTRTGDYDTSIAGAESVRMRRRSQQFKLLREFCLASDSGLTDEEAADAAQVPVRSCYWKRCSELRQMGLIEPTDQRRNGDAGVQRIVSVVTEKGIHVYKRVLADG